LGALPENTPALYSLMNYADIKGGTWFPKAGMYSIVDAMYKLAIELGVRFYFNQNVIKIEVQNDAATKVISENTDKKQIVYDADVIIGNADYHHIENKLLPAEFRNYSESYWDNRIMAPGCILYFIGLNKKLKNITHHSLFFDTSFEKHAEEIYTTKQWPSDPLFYTSATSVTDSSLAPPGCENLFFLIPVAAGLADDTDERRKYYLEKIVERYEKRTGESIRESIVFEKSFAYSDFVRDYNAFKGNAYGLANTLRQTAILRRLAMASG
jgi:phytoene desaturase